MLQIAVLHDERYQIPGTPQIGRERPLGCLELSKIELNCCYFRPFEGVMIYGHARPGKSRRTAQALCDRRGFRLPHSMACAEEGKCRPTCLRRSSHNLVETAVAIFFSEAHSILLPLDSQTDARMVTMSQHHVGACG